MSHSRPLVMRSFWSFARFFAAPYLYWYLAGVIALFATTAISLWLPQVSKQVINALGEQAQSVHSVSAAGGNASITTTSIENAPLLIIVFGLTLTLVRSLSRILIFWPGQKVASDARSWVMRQFIRIRHQQIIEAGLGDLISRMSNDVTHLRLMCGFGLLQLANLIFLLGFALVLMLKTDVILTVLALAPISVMLVVTYIGMPFMTRYSREQQEIMGLLTNKVTESFVNVQGIQIHVARPAFEARIERENQKLLRSSIKLMAVRNFTFPFMILFSGIAEVLVLFYGGFKVIQGGMTVGDIMTFNVYVGLLGFPLAAVGIIASLMQRARTALDRLHEVESSPKEEFDVDAQFVWQPSAGPRGSIDTTDTKDTRPLIEFRNTRFVYPGRPDSQVLRGVSFALGKAEHVGICGPVGSGKSTLLSLAARIYDPTPGQVFLNGQDVCEIEPQELRARIRLMPQTVHLFSDSIRSNLGFGIQPDPSENDLIAVCKRAQIWSDIQALPNGLDTEIGERGVRLSGGQRQRLALARLLLHEADVYLLDDVVSAVDTRTEAAILEELFRLPNPFLVVSHRPVTLSRCDRIVYLRDGIIEYDGPYSKMDPRLIANLGDDSAASDEAKTV